MANIGTVEGILRLKDLLTPGLKRSSKELEKYAKEVEKRGGGQDQESQAVRFGGPW